MSETLCTLRTKGGGGGRYKETSLWTNPSPTSTFANTTVTLSDSISNYKYLGIRYRMSTSDAEENIAIFNIDDVKQSVQGGSTNHNILLIGAETSANALFGRIVFYVSDTSITLQQCYRLYSQTIDNTLAIPLEILGLNELQTGTRECAIGTETYQTSSNYKVTLGFKPKALQVFMRGNDTNTITLQYDESISTTKYIRNYTASTPQSGWQTMGTTNQRRLLSIDDDGFTLTPNTDTSHPTIYYSAVGDA